MTKSEILFDKIKYKQIAFGHLLTMAPADVILGEESLIECVVDILKLTIKHREEKQKEKRYDSIKSQAAIKNRNRDLKNNKRTKTKSSKKT